jgi:hypothetical protein
MSKIHKIKISNFKSIDEFEADFKGCTALVTGGNNSGKTSFLRGIPDRIRFIRPDLMVRNGEKEGKGEMVLTTGERFVWEFDNEGRDKLTLFTNDGLKQSVTKDLGTRFFPTVFDIDKFLQSSPKAQVKQLQAIVGLDFTDIDQRYDKAYNFRTERNRDAELYHAKLEKMLKCDPVEFVDLTDLQRQLTAEKERLNRQYQANKKSNDQLRDQWNKEKERINQECIDHNKEQVRRRQIFEQCKNAFRILTDNGFDGIGTDADDFVKSLERDILPGKTASELYPKEPEYIAEMPDSTELDRINQQIIKASEINAAAQKYKEYIDHKKATEDAKDIARQADEAVRAIEEERKRMVESVHMPAGITFGTDGILVDGLPLDKNQISTSKLYCAALRIASMNLGEVKTLYFDASFLDRNSLAEIEQWAVQNDLQLLIERPDFDAGEMRYEIIETSQPETIGHE